MLWEINTGWMYSYLRSQLLSCAAGYLRIVGRIKDMNIRWGENIYPAEIEDVIHRHPAVNDVQAVGVPDDRLGEQLCACIVIKPGHSATDEDIKAFCRDKMSHFKGPHYVKFVSGYPQTASGKVQKFKIREELISQQESGAL